MSPSLLACCFVEALLAVDLAYALEPREYDKGDEICQRSGGRRKVEHCRAPVSPLELEAARIQGRELARQEYEYRRNYARLESCSFSVFTSWPGEENRLKKKLDQVNFALAFARSELNSAASDIAKQRYLASDVVASAYQKHDFYSKMIADQSRQMTGIQWCIDCAQKRAGGAKQCD